VSVGVRSGLAAGGLAALLAGASTPALAFVPPPERALAAVAQANAASGRTQAFQLELVMRIGDRDAVATGELVSHPSGLARLELRGSGGRVDRYLLAGPDLQAAKDGEPLPDPQPLLQPVFLLQPASQETLFVALESFGIDGGAIGLAPCGDLDCYVFGDPSLAAPKRIVLPGAGSDPAIGDAAAGGAPASGGRLELAPAPASGGPVARLWVDSESLQIQRIDRASGESVLFGPLARFERLMVPAWLEIQEPGRDTIRFDVKRAIRVNANPQAFNPSWLFSPIDPVAPAGGAAPALAAPAPGPAAGRAPSSP